MPYPGSADQLQLVVDPYDGTTLATVTVTNAAGTTLTPTAVSSDGGHTWTANPTWPAAGEWVARWATAGVGAGKTEQSVWVSQPASPAALVTWRPELWHVADYIPGRTLVGAVDGYGNALNLFTTTTHPPAGTVQRLITAGCAWVSSRTGPVDVSLTEMARATAALYAAASAERGYPDSGKDVQIADQLFTQAGKMLDQLHAANLAITGVDVEDPAAHLLPVYNFPVAHQIAPWGDFDFL